MRALTSLTTLLTLVLGLGACGDDKGTTTQTTQTPATDSMATDPSAGSTTNPDGTTTDAPTTMNPSTPTSTTDPTTGEDTTAGTATDPSAGTTTDATTATTTDATVGTTTTNGDDTTGGGGGEDLYGPCMMANPPCAGGQQCIMIDGIDGSFCAPDCEGMGCPDVPAGVKAQAMCVLTEPMKDKPTLCALICNPMAKDECPQGETCKQVPMQMGVGLCTAP